MKILLAPLAVLLALLPFARAYQGGADYAELRERAERYYAEGSFELAHRLYREAAESDVPEAEARWVAFRTADTRWRSAAATSQTDTTAFDEARTALVALVRDVQRPEERDELWAEVQESLADFHWDRRQVAQWGEAWPRYQQALEYWGRATDIERARARYLAMVWRMARPTWFEAQWDYGSWGNQVPAEVLRNAVEIAVAPEDRARAHYLLGRSLLRHGDWGQRARAGEAFRVVAEMAAAGERTEWVDDALFHYGQWLEQGRAEMDERGQWALRPDFPGAVRAYRRLMDAFRPSETRYWPQAQNRVRDITGATVDVAVGRAFFPGSEVEARLAWRNVEAVELSLYRLDLAQHVSFSNGDVGSHAWLDQVDVARLERVRRWAHPTGDEGLHLPGGETVRLDPAPSAGAWLLEARGGGARSRALVLVSDAALALKTSGREALVWFCGASNGAPVAGADVTLWEREYDGSRWRWRRATGTTGADGTATFPLRRDRRSGELWVAAATGERQAFALGGRPWSADPEHTWRAYAFTDRPAYRPGDTVSWKLVARTHDGGRYATPAGARLAWKLYDPRGADAASGTCELNEFGAAWGELPTTAAMALGAYQLHLEEIDGTGGRRHVASSPLFRLEEYELPEFEVSVELPEEDGRAVLFAVGDTVRAEIAAEYYFGGPVADAAVEVLVYQRPFWQDWNRPRPYPWYFEHQRQRHWWGGPGQLVTRQTLTTDRAGRAAFEFETPAGAGQDFEYTVEARVIDASRREVTGRGTVRVTRAPYRVFAWAEHDLHRPGDAVEIHWRALDANDEPVVAEGLVEVTRERWSREDGAYERQVVEQTTLATDEEGEALLRFTAPVEGYYRVRWVGELVRGSRVTAETTVWVCDEDTEVLGYHHGGVQLLVDKDTFRAGERAPVMISAPASGRHVLFTVERERLLSYEVLHLSGEVKLVTLDLTEDHVPNIVLGALLLHDGQAHMDSAQVVVPPVEQFLDVELVADRESVQPGEEGELTVCVRDHEGVPVRGEIALALVDEAVTAIQTDLAGDPRPFFYGELRPHRVQTSGTFHQLAYAHLVEDEEGGLVDRRLADLEGDDSFRDYDGRHGERRERMAAKAAAPSVGRASFEAQDALRQVANAPMEMSEEVAGSLVPGAAGGGPVPRVRADFRKTALWLPAVVTDDDGCARTTVRYPDSLTRWEGTARVQTAESRFGIAKVRVRTQMPLMARLQAPRFFQVGDEVVVSGILNNRTGGELAIEAQLDVEGLELLGRLEDGALVAAPASVRIERDGEARVDWRVRVTQPGEARLALTAVGGEFADAMERRFPVHERGAEVFLARTGALDAAALQVDLELPAARRPGSAALTVEVTPSLAVTMLDALPYLVEYPYGCTEQTLSRFLPATVVARTLEDVGLSPEVAMTRVFGGIEREYVDETHPPSDRRRSLDALGDVTSAGVARLVDFQHADGGWGWWKEGESELFMSGYALWGLTLARDAGVEVPAGVLERAAHFLDERIVRAEARPDLQAWLLHALATWKASSDGGRASVPMRRAFDGLWVQRARLNAYTRALYALAAHALGRDEEARVLVDNLVNGVQIDERPDTSVVTRGAPGSHPAVQATAHWGDDGIFWRWSEGGVEATATALRALLAIAPEHELVDPVANWLIRGRRAASWSNTRDTAMCVLALNDFLRVRGELGGEAAWQVVVNGEVVDEQRLAGDQLLAAPTRVRVGDSALVDGTNRIEIRQTGDAAGRLYFACHATFFSSEEPIPAHGSEVFVRRDYYRIVPRPTLLAGPWYEKVPLEDGGAVEAGERVEVVLTLEAKNHLEYVVVEDFKPAGLEAVEQKSGGAFYARELKASETTHRFGRRNASFDRSGSHADHGATGRQRWVHRELRDRKIALFLDRLPEGVWEMRYELFARTPGRFSAPPALAEAMYVPEIRANSAEWRMTVRD